mgnify:CR=1 FL=1
MRIISWNVNGIRAVAKKDFFESINKMAPDILCLQETKAQDHEVEETLSDMEHYTMHYNSADKKGYSGTALLSKTEPLAVTKDMQVSEHDSNWTVWTTVNNGMPIF